jgi:hypothetical protein
VPARRYTDQQFLDAVADPEVRTVADLCRRLGIVPRGGNYDVVRRHASRLGVRIQSNQQRAPQPLPDEASLREAVMTSRSMAGVLRALGLPDAGGTRARVRRAIDRHGLDTAHHQGQGWNRGQRGERVRTRLEDLSDGKVRSGTTVKRVLLREGWPPRCARCEREKWLGGAIPLELDHIDGDRTNNDPANLRLLCPNCHALTPTYRGRNIGRRSEARRSPAGSS